MTRTPLSRTSTAVFNLDRTECAQAGVKGYFGKLYANNFQALDELADEVKTGCRRCNGTFVAGINGLVAILVPRAEIFTPLGTSRKQHPDA